MNNGALPREAFEELEAYVLGTMDAGRRQRFEERLAADPALRAEMERQRADIRAVEMAGIERALRAARAGQGAASGRGGARYAVLLKYAAMLAVLVGALAWWLGRPAANERLFAQHFTPDPGLPVPMSTAGDPAFQDAMVAYKLGDYAEAAGKWEKLLQASPGNDTLQYFIASAELAGGRAAAAVPLFKQVAAEPRSAFHAKARWFLYLAYLRLGDRQAMRALDMPRDTVYGDRAREIESLDRP